MWLSFDLKMNSLSLPWLPDTGLRSKLPLQGFQVLCLSVSSLSVPCLLSNKTGSLNCQLGERARFWILRITCCLCSSGHLPLANPLIMELKAGRRNGIESGAGRGVYKSDRKLKRAWDSIQQHGRTPCICGFGLPGFFLFLFFSFFRPAVWL